MLTIISFQDIWTACYSLLEVDLKFKILWILLSVREILSCFFVFCCVGPRLVKCIGKNIVKLNFTICSDSSSEISRASPIAVPFPWSRAALLVSVREEQLQEKWASKQLGGGQKQDMTEESAIIGHHKPGWGSSRNEYKTETSLILS